MRDDASAYAGCSVSSSLFIESLFIGLRIIANFHKQTKKAEAKRQKHADGAVWDQDQDQKSALSTLAVLSRQTRVWPVLMKCAG